MNSHFICTPCPVLPSAGGNHGLFSPGTGAGFTSIANSCQGLSRPSTSPPALPQTGFFLLHRQAFEFKKPRLQFWEGSRGRRGIWGVRRDQRKGSGAWQLVERLPHFCQAPAPPTHSMGQGRMAGVAQGHHVARTGPILPRQAPRSPMSRQIQDRTPDNGKRVSVGVARGSPCWRAPRGAPLTWSSGPCHNSPLPRGRLLEALLRLGCGGERKLGLGVCVPTCFRVL